MFVTPIPRNVRLAEAPSFGKPILLYDVQSVGAKSYLAVAQELMRRVESGALLETPEPMVVSEAAGMSEPPEPPESTEPPESSEPLPEVAS
jgi:chromosome partitioning protein